MNILNFTVNSTSKKEHKPNCLTKVTVPKMAVINFKLLIGYSVLF